MSKKTLDLCCFNPSRCEKSTTERSEMNVFIVGISSFDSSRNVRTNSKELKQKIQMLLYMFSLYM